MKINLQKWFTIILSVFVLSLSINTFSFEDDFVTGGIDGTCIVIGKFFSTWSKSVGFSYNYALYVTLHIIALIICFFQEKINVFFKTCFIVILLLINLKFISFLENKYVLHLSEIYHNIIKKIYIGTNLSMNKFFYTSIFSGIIFGITLGKIRKYGYTTGGMDIYQKFLKDNFHFSFTLVLFLTDGIIIFLAFLKDFIDDSMGNNMLIHFINRIIFPYISLIIIGFLMNRLTKKNKN